MANCFATNAEIELATRAVNLFGAAGISSAWPMDNNQLQRNIIALERPVRRDARNI